MAHVTQEFIDRRIASNRRLGIPDDSHDPGLLNPPLAVGQRLIEDGEEAELWERVSFDVSPDVPGQAVRRLDRMAAEGNEVARGVLWTLAVEGAEARLTERGATDAG
jgi:hypothetical protein